MGDRVTDILYAGIHVYFHSCIFPGSLSSWLQMVHGRSLHPKSGTGSTGPVRFNYFAVISNQVCNFDFDGSADSSLCV